MSAWLIALTGGIYAAVAVQMGFKGNLPMTIVYAGYAFSNIGLYIISKGSA